MAYPGDIMAKKRNKKDKKKSDAEKKMKEKEETLKEAAAEMMNANKKYTHEQGCPCPLCRLARVELTVNQLSKFMNIILPWFDKVWKERGEGINPITGTIMEKEKADKATLINEKILGVEADKELQPRILFSELNDVGGIKYYLVRPKSDGPHIKDHEFIVMKLGIDEETNIYEEILTIDEYYSDLEKIIKNEESLKDKKKFLDFLVTEITKKDIEKSKNEKIG